VSLPRTTGLFVNGCVLSRLVLRAGLHGLFVDGLLARCGVEVP
jgi:hypothetical protein